jgi:hypothetical protein
MSYQFILFLIYFIKNIYYIFISQLKNFMISKHVSTTSAFLMLEINVITYL